MRKWQIEKTIIIIIIIPRIENHTGPLSFALLMPSYSMCWRESCLIFLQKVAL